MNLVDFEKLESQIENEHEEIDIRGTARSLLGLKQLMGPVTSVWSDYVLESVKNSELSFEERKKVIEFMESDIRRAVKKNKSKPVFGSIVAFIAMQQTEIADYAYEYSKLLGVNIEKLYNRMKNEKSVSKQVIEIFKILFYKHDKEMYEIFCKLENVKPTNTFKRYSRKRINYIVSNLDNAKIKMSQFIRNYKEDDEL